MSKIKERLLFNKNEKRFIEKLKYKKSTLGLKTILVEEKK